MQLPNAEQAVVDEVKIRTYLLSSEHPVGRFKAAFFRGLGFESGGLACPAVRAGGPREGR